MRVGYYMKLENVVKLYKTNHNEVKALDNINYDFETGKLYAVMGHSGSGKSTLINILGLIEPLTSGTYYINNKNIIDLTDIEASELRMKNIGFIYQDFYLDEYLNALENVMLPMLINNEMNYKEKLTRANQLLDNLGLEERKIHFPKELSGGEKQRVAIARALANNPGIILADEPTGNLDEENEIKIFTELKKLSSLGKCVIVVTHTNLIKKYADEVLNISKGKLEVNK